MRRFDKKHNITKANLLAEQRYFNIKEGLNELDTQKYSDLMDKTYDFPWTNYLGNKEKGGKEGRVNRLARERFIQEYMKEFPKGTPIELVGKSGKIYKLGFNTISFDTNYAKYILLFNRVGDDRGFTGSIWIHYPNYIDNAYMFDEPVELTKESKFQINKMFKYMSGMTLASTHNPDFGLPKVQPQAEPEIKEKPGIMQSIKNKVFKK